MTNEEYLSNQLEIMKDAFHNLEIHKEIWKNLYIQQTQELVYLKIMLKKQAQKDKS